MQVRIALFLGGMGTIKGSVSPTPVRGCDGLVSVAALTAHLAVIHYRSASSPFRAQTGGMQPHTPCLWWTIKGSNLGPTGYEPVALTN